MKRDRKNSAANNIRVTKRTIITTNNFFPVSFPLLFGSHHQRPLKHQRRQDRDAKSTINPRRNLIFLVPSSSSTIISFLLKLTGTFIVPFTCEFVRNEPQWVRNYLLSKPKSVNGATIRCG